MSRYSKEHYEDVAGLLRATGEKLASAGQGYGAMAAVGALAYSFAFLFYADHPAYCSHCGQHEEEAATSACHTFDETHDLEGGFGHTEFLRACGLESEVQTWQSQ